MSFSYNDIKDEIRLLLSDLTNGGDEHWNDSMIEVWLNSGVKEIRRRRHDAKLSGWDEITYVDYDITSPTTDTILDDIFKNALIFYIVHKCFQQDLVKGSQEAADRYFQMFKGEL